MADSRDRGGDAAARQQPQQPADAAPGELEGSPEDIRLVDELVSAARRLKQGQLDEDAFEERLKVLWGNWLEGIGEEDEET